MSTFAKLLRNSNFVNFGSFDGCYVVGQVVHRVKDTLFIDFDSKFNAICQRPRENAEKYLIGSPVVIHLHDTELSERFLGSKHDLTLMEADAQLLGLFRPRRRDLMRKMGETIKPEEIRLCVRR